MARKTCAAVSVSRSAVCGRANSGFNATAPFVSGANPQRVRPASTWPASVAIQRRISGSSSGPSHASALSRSELGNGSKRPKLPVAIQV